MSRNCCPGNIFYFYRKAGKDKYFWWAAIFGNINCAVAIYVVLFLEIVVNDK